MSIKGGIRKTSTGNYLAGSKMTVSCEDGYLFYGYPEYICDWNGTWLPTNNVPLSKFHDWPGCERIIMNQSNRIFINHQLIYIKIIYRFSHYWNKMVINQHFDYFSFVIYWSSYLLFQSYNL